MIYVLGFAFTQDHKSVVLIRKNHPTWQAGLLNGVGGKVEETDKALQDAMAREFQEETGVKTSWRDWSLFTTMKGPADNPWVVFCFKGFFDFNLDLSVVRDEPVNWFNVGTMANLDTIPNLKWLVPLALERQMIDVVLVQEMEKK